MFLCQKSLRKYQEIWRKNQEISGNFHHRKGKSRFSLWKHCSCSSTFLRDCLSAVTFLVARLEILQRSLNDSKFFYSQAAPVKGVVYSTAANTSLDKILLTFSCGSILRMKYVSNCSSCSFRYFSLYVLYCVVVDPIYTGNCHNFERAVFY